MKLTHLYTNDEAIFVPIKFRADINAIVARIQHPTDEDKSSHCLGKTLLIDVLDFCLLKSVGTRGHFLKTRDDLFGELVFFLEIEIEEGNYVTVRRPVRDATRIAFKRHQAKHQNLSSTKEEEWDHVGVALTSSVRLLDGYLDLTSIKPWPYRKGVSYFMRRQEDYSNEFQLRKFMNGNHKDWKPYVARVLGFDETALIAKYEADTAEASLRSERSELQSEVPLKVGDYEKLQAKIMIKGDEVSEKVAALDRFDFKAQEVGLNQQLSDEIESRIALLNERIYNATFDLAQIRRGLEYKVEFDLNNVQRIFKEAQLTFPEQLAKDYSELIEFNKRIHEERRVGLSNRARIIEEELRELDSELNQLSQKRAEILQILGGSDSLAKFKGLQRELDRDRASLAFMQEKAIKLDALRRIDDRLREAREQKEQLIGSIGELLRAGSDRFQGIQRVFSRIINDVLHRTAILYVKQNDSGNVDFHAEYTEADSDEETQERRGTTFRKVLCIAFDLAVLINYSKERFFHFVYHDGALEQLESRRKLALLSVIRSACKDFGIQYIFSTIEEELPTADDPDKLCPQPDEIILELHDGGNDGRLFRLDKF